MEKRFIQEEDLLLDAYRLGVKIYQSGFRPTFIVAIWRGGSSVGIAVQECLQYLGVETDHISIRTSYRGMTSYKQMLENAAAIRIHGTRYLLENLNADDGLLIVDDVYSSGLNVQALIDRLAQRTKRNMPREVRVAVPWFKPGHNRTARVPDYHLHETEDWLVLPWELDGLTRAEIDRHKSFLTPIFDRLAAAGGETTVGKQGAGILVLCTGNSCRSQITEALLRQHAGDRFEVHSAGTEPAGEIHPMVFKVMAEKGLDLSGQYPKDYREFLGRIPVHTVIIVCDGAAKSCPSVWPGVMDRLMWPTDDPAAFAGNEEQTLAEFRRVRDELEARVLGFLDASSPQAAGVPTRPAEQER